MTTIQTLHIDSSYRNRIEYPNPADFVAPYGSTTGNSILTMTNPVTNELPVYNFVFPLVPPYNQSIDFVNGTSPVANSSLRVGITSWNSNKVILSATDMNAIFGASSSSKEQDFLRNLYFVYGTVAPYTLVRIVAYDSLTYTVTLANPVTLNLSVTNFCYLYNDSDVSSSPFQILLTGSLTSFQRNYVRKNNLTLFNATRNQQMNVDVTADGMYLVNSVGSSSLTGWSVNDFYILFNNEPMLGRLTTFPDGTYASYTVGTLTLVETTTGFPINGTFTMYQLDDGLISPIEIVITSVDFQGRIRNWEVKKRGYGIIRGRSYFVQGTSSSGDPLYAVFRVATTYQAFLVQGSVTLSPNEFFTPLVFTPLYHHDHLFVNDEMTYNIFPTIYEQYDRLATIPYDQLQNITGTSIVYGFEPFVGGNTMIYTTAYDESVIQLLNASYTNVWWQSVVFSTMTMDQFVPLNYSGSTVSQDQLVCYEIELLNLILPNLELNTTRVLTSFYPYIFVELSNNNAFSRNVNNLYTNNQYGQSALFAVPISDVNSPETSQFLNLNNCKSVMTVKFKPNDSLHFRVFLTNGETFTPYLKDTLPPMSPNPLVQITAVFSLRRL